MYNCYRVKNIPPQQPTGVSKTDSQDNTVTFSLLLGWVLSGPLLSILGLSYTYFKALVGTDKISELAHHSGK